MRLLHLGLPVRDFERSLRFYTAYFGFDPATAQTYPDGTTIVRNAESFDLALHPAPDAVAAEGFLHFGFFMADASRSTRCGCAWNTTACRSSNATTNRIWSRSSASTRMAGESRSTGRADHTPWASRSRWVSGRYRPRAAGRRARSGG